MTIRIPPSLKRLVVKRATLAGQIKLQSKIFEAQFIELTVHQERLALKREKTLSLLKRDLAAIDRSIRMHEILVNPKLIEAKRIQSRPRTTHYGAITKAIFGALELAAPEAVTTADVTKVVIAKFGLDDSPEKYQAYSKRSQGRCAWRWNWMCALRA